MSWEKVDQADVSSGRVGIGLPNRRRHVLRDEARGPTGACCYVGLGSWMVQLLGPNGWCVERGLFGVTNDIGLRQYEFELQ